MPTVLEKAVLLDETGQEIVSKLDDIKDAIGTSGEFIPLMIKVTTPPTKTAYMAGEQLDLTGLVVNLVGTNGAQIDVTSACTFSPANGTTLTSANTNVSISYYYPKDEYTFSSTQNISVYNPSSIRVSTYPTKRNYMVGEQLDLTGIVVEAVYDLQALTKDVTSSCVFNPANGTVLTMDDYEIDISYTEGGTTLTTSMSIRIDRLHYISVTTPPTKTEYKPNEVLDLSGIVVTAHYTDSSTKDVTSSCVYNPANGTTLTLSDTEIEISYTEQGYTKTTTQEITISEPIYGVEWDGSSSPAWTRTDDAVSFTDPVPYYSGMTETPSSPFDNIMPWSGMVTEERTGGTMVKIPKFWYRITQGNAGIKIQITNSAQDGFSVSPAHMDRDDGNGERDFVYIGRYNCASGTYKSETGKTPIFDQTRSTFRSSIHNLGSDIWQDDFALRFTVWLLYLVEFANWNSQLKIGQGCSASGSVETMGYTDSMPYHTGTTATSRSAYGGTQYRNIEGLWDNVYDYIDGCYYNSSGLNIILDPSSFSDSNNGTPVGTPQSGFPTGFSVVNVQGTFPMFIPTGYQGSNSTYSCDRWLYGSTDACIYTGGYYYQNLDYGLFYMNKTRDTTISYITGSRIMELPSAS